MTGGAGEGGAKHKFTYLSPLPIDLRTHGLPISGRFLHLFLHRLEVSARSWRHIAHDEVNVQPKRGNLPSATAAVQLCINLAPCTEEMFASTQGCRLFDDIDR